MRQKGAKLMEIRDLQNRTPLMGDFQKNLTVPIGAWTHQR
jgi:hypothetical protein